MSDDKQTAQEIRLMIQNLNQAINRAALENGLTIRLEVQETSRMILPDPVPVLSAVIYKPV